MGPGGLVDIADRLIWTAAHSANFENNVAAQFGGGLYMYLPDGFHFVRRCVGPWS